MNALLDSTTSAQTLAVDILALARAELHRRLVSGESNHVDEEEYLIPRWEALLPDGSDDAIAEMLVEAVGYVSSQRVRMRPSNPAYRHKTTPNCDWADRILEALHDSPAGAVHRSIVATLHDRKENGRSTPVVGCFAPIHSCFSTYRWQRWGACFLAFKFSQGDMFVDYVVVSAGDAMGYAARYPRVLAQIAVG